MKKFIIPFLAAFFFIQISASAQLSVGGGLTLNSGEGWSQPGLAVRGSYEINENWRINPIFNYIFPESYGGVGFGNTYKINFFDLSLEANYVHSFSENFSAYGIAGLDYFMFRAKVGDEKTSDGEFGVPIGGGVNYQFNDRLSGFGEVKYLISNADRTVWNFGVMYRI